MRLMHDYPVDDIVYVEMAVMYHKLDNNKQGPCIITDVFTNITF